MMLYELWAADRPPVQKVSRLLGSAECTPMSPPFDPST